ncbi:MAG: hypothetical protein HQ463_01010 [Bacteroidetes bacterium]|nr:hypothetical protein [Bacteroidota bacterium]
MKIKIIYFTLFGLVLMFGCKKSNKNKNPYDNWSNTTKAPANQDSTIDPNTIQGLHKNIFKPTCANSGCHDGNFEPDFRSVESSYNSLIGRLVTNTDPNNSSLTKRVVPSNSAASMLLHRINVFIPGSQGKMPLSLEPNSDWTAKQAEYIQNITNWINAGAKDQFGASPASYDFSPQIGGLIAFADGSSTPLGRSGNSPINIPGGTTNVKLMVAYSDDKTPLNNFGATTLNYTLDPNNYSNTEKTMTKESSSFLAKGFNGTDVNYWFSITIPLSQLGIMGNVIWIRTITTDNVNGLTIIPNVTASFKAKTYFALRIN